MASRSRRRAEPLLRRAIAIFENIRPRSVEIAPALNNLAALYQRQERFADAEPLFRRALAIRENRASPGHPDLTIPQQSGDVL
jgi:tetratricopeptide (TPR) repeat protein